MSTLTQYNVLHYRSLGHYFHYLPLSRSISSCSVITKPRNSKQLNINEPAVDNSLAKPVVLSSPSASLKRRVILDDPSLQSTWSHRAWVASGSTVVIISLAECISGAATSHIWLQPLLASFVGYLLADLGSGIYHWGIDNYGDASTPIFGSQIEAFQGHHQFPWTITKRQFANNLHSLASAITFVVLPLDLVFNQHPLLLGFVGTCSGCIMFSQQFHAWAHGTKSKLPPLVVGLQDAGVLVSRSQHAAHHRQPYNNNYCIVSGLWNKILDQLQVFQTLEMILFFKLGVILMLSGLKRTFIPIKSFFRSRDIYYVDTNFLFVPPLNVYIDLHYFENLLISVRKNRSRILYSLGGTNIYIVYFPPRGLSHHAPLLLTYIRSFTISVL